MKKNTKTLSDSDLNSSDSLYEWERLNVLSKNESFVPFRTPLDKLMAQTPEPKMVKQTGLEGVELDEPNATIMFHAGSSTTNKITSTQPKSAKPTKSAFSVAFANARKAGLETFEFKGKKFNTMLAGESKEQWKKSLEKRTAINREKIIKPLPRVNQPPAVSAVKDNRLVPKTASEMGFGMSGFQVYQQKAKQAKKK